MKARRWVYDTVKKAMELQLSSAPPHTWPEGTPQWGMPVAGAQRIIAEEKLS